MLKENACVSAAGLIAATSKAGSFGPCAPDFPGRTVSAITSIRRVFIPTASCSIPDDARLLRGGWFDRVSQHAPKDLPDHTLRQLRAKLDAGGDLVRRELRATERTQIVFAGHRSRAEHDPSANGLAFDGIGHARHANLGYGGMRRQHFLDFAGPDLLTARLDQVFLPVHDEQIAVVVEIPEVASVQPAAGAVGV